MTESPAKRPVDPMRSFAGVLMATLLLEMLVVLLSIPVVANLGSGMATWQGVLVGALAVALLLDLRGACAGRGGSGWPPACRWS